MHKLTLNINDSAIDEFMSLLNHFSDKDIVIENQSFMNEKARLQQKLKSIDDGAIMINDSDFWDSTEKTINT